MRAMTLAGRLSLERTVPPSRSNARQPRLADNSLKEDANDLVGGQKREGTRETKLPGWRGFPSTSKMVPRLAPAF